MTGITKNNMDTMPEDDSYSDSECMGEPPREDNKDSERVLARNETKAVHCLRLVVLTVLVSVAVVFAVAVYLYMKEAEEETFRVQFYDLANRLVDGFHANAKLRLQTIHMFATSISSTAQQTQQVWPLVSIDDYDARATAARAILGSRYLALYPIVTRELRRVWEEFTLDPANLKWVEQSAEFQAEFYATHNRNFTLPTYTRRLLEVNDTLNLQGDDDSEFYNNSVTYVEPYYFGRQIYRAGVPSNPNDMADWVYEDDDAPGPFYPMWHNSPLTSAELASINYNVYDPYWPDAYIDGVKVVTDTQQAVFAGVWNVNDDGYVIEDDDYNDRDVPITSLMYPVFDKITGDDKQLVAIVDLNVEFGPFFASVLPPSNDIITVVSNCDQTFTFQVSGETAIFVGPNDLHDPDYDEFVVTAKMTDFEMSAGGTVYNGVPVNEDWCPWELKVYATKDMEDAFLTSRPLYYLAGVLGVFLVTCLTFIGYDVLVGRRHKVVMTTAVKSDKIVSSLFPTTFREALYKDNHQNEKKGNEHKFNWKGGSEQIQLATGSQEDEVVPTKIGEPMARLYSDCTVFFCDIAGFTAWSSVRSPEQVFTLLETVYAAFDKLAAKHDVFKIETIGDCYVAVTGLPEPQANHALLMVKFARDCLNRMSQITSHLEGSLGSGTKDLAIRVGLHSGPVTAGILRGQKARFQLFGDTVNTASRMESNGLKNCIHASQETAWILKAMGKEHWVHAREDKVIAKGKGELQTYWIRPMSSASAVTSLSSFVYENDVNGNGNGKNEKEEMEDLPVGLDVTRGSMARWTTSCRMDYDAHVEV